MTGFIKGFWPDMWKDKFATRLVTAFQKWLVKEACNHCILVRFHWLPCSLHTQPSLILIKTALMNSAFTRAQSSGNYRQQMLWNLHFSSIIVSFLRWWFINLQPSFGIVGQQQPMWLVLQPPSILTLMEWWWLHPAVPCLPVAVRTLCWHHIRSCCFQMASS